MKSNKEHRAEIYAALAAGPQTVARINEKLGDPRQFRRVLHGLLQSRRLRTVMVPGRPWTVELAGSARR